jgi:large repetitive protein
MLTLHKRTHGMSLMKHFNWRRPRLAQRLTQADLPGGGHSLQTIGLSAYRRLLLILLSGALLLTAMWLALHRSQAVTANFDRRFPASGLPASDGNIRGDILVIGNMLNHCRASANNCGDARRGGNYDDDNFYMIDVDADGDPGTFNSSRAKLNLPVGASVRFAGLYWGADLDGTDSDDDGNGVDARNRSLLRNVKLDTPAAGGYMDITGGIIIGCNGTNNCNGNLSAIDDYQAFKDVTALVSAGGSGFYTVANVQAARGENEHAGWSLVVVYEDPNPATPWRNLTVFDGFAFVDPTDDDDNQANIVDFEVNGFLTPTSGQFETYMALVTYDGDRTKRKESVTLTSRVSSSNRKSTRLAFNPYNRSDNFFNSTITDLGTRIGDPDNLNDPNRQPSYANTLGLDIDRFRLSGGSNASDIVLNGSREAEIRLTTDKDGIEGYIVGVLTFATAIHSPDIKPEKTVTAVDRNNDNQLNAGDELIYTIRGRNRGLDSAVSVVLRDDIPSNTTYKTGSLTITNGVAATASTATRLEINLGAGANASTGGRLAVNDTFEITFCVTVNASPGSEVCNQATIQYRGETTGQTFNDLSNRVCVSTGNPPPPIDVYVTKMDAPDPVCVGSRLTYTLTVGNNGAQPSSPVTLIDTLPANVTVLSLPNGCTSASGIITCNLDSIAPLTTAALTIVVRPEPAAVGTVTNSARVTTGTPDSNPSNDEAMIDTTVLPLADLTITKTDAPDPVLVGNDLTYTLNVINNGPNAAPNAELTDVLPSGTTFRSLTPAPGFTCTTPPVGGTGTVTCANPSLAVGTSASFTLLVRVNNDVADCTRLTNTAQVASDADACDSTPNSATTETLVGIGADLMITKVDQTDPVIAGKTLSYTIVATNNSTCIAAQDLTIRDIVPANTTFASLTPSPGGNCTTPLLGETGQVSCTWLGATTPGVARSITLVVNINPSTSNGATITNTAMVSSVTPDPDSRNNSATSTTQVITRADLFITKTDQPDPVFAGEDLSYSITATNTNTPPCSDAQNVRISDTLPPNVTVKSLTPSAGGVCTPVVNGAFFCTWSGATTPGATRSIALVVTVDACAIDGDTLRNTATVTSDTQDDNLSNNTVMADTTVRRKATLTITKTDAPDPTVAGRTLAYTVTATNNGPSCADDITITDVLPPQTQLNEPPVPSAGGSCTGTSTIACRWPGATRPGTQRSVRIVVRVDPCTPHNAALDNTATVASVRPTASASITERTTVRREPDLRLEMTDAPDPVLAGNLLTYTLRATNIGVSCAKDVTIDNPLPAGVTLVSATPIGNGRRLDAQRQSAKTNVLQQAGVAGRVTMIWDGETAPGASREMALVVRICAEVACGTLLANAATTATLDPDVDLNNNAATATTLVQAQSDLAIIKSGTPNPVRTGTQVVYTLDVTNNGPSNSINTIVTDTLPKGFTVASVSTPVGTFTVTGDATKTITINLGTMGAVGQCATTFPVIVRITITADVPSTYPTQTVVNRATVATGNCLADPNPDNNTADFLTSVIPTTNDPGPPIPAPLAPSDTLPGSVLVYNLYTSSVSSPAAENTRINITNTAQQNVAVHLFFVDGSTCSIADALICLTKNQTASFLASDLDPGTTGYLVAVAVDEETGLPRAFNYLIGDAYIKLSSGHQANLTAESFAALMFPPAGTDASATTAVLNFDGMSYSLAPRTLAVSNIPDRASGNDTRIVLNRLGGNLAIGAATLGAIFGVLFDDAENAYSFTFNVGGCQFRGALSNNFPRTTPRFEQIIGAGRSGWLKLWAANDAGLLGAVLNFNSGATTSAGAFNQGRNLHKLTLTNAVSLIIPIFPPNC